MVEIRNAVVVLLDSLRRDLLGAYGGREFDTPSIDRLAKRGVRFTHHFSGSLPCMPARHDLLCGALDFPWKPWGSVEVWERPIPYYLGRSDVVTHLVSDHPHLFEAGGENYHTDFYSWDYQRGHESDPWQTILDETLVGTPSYHRPRDYPYHRNRRMFRNEADYPGPKTLEAAARWLDENATAHDRFLLFVDEFDPHEPFDTPEPYSTMYDPSWKDAPLIWPPYSLGAIGKAEARQIRAQYGGKLTMIDRWLGRIIDAMDRNRLWDSTLFILVTDHGHFLGEHDCWGKPPAPPYDTLSHIPLVACWPGCNAGETCGALTTNVDLCETLLDLFGVRHTRQRRHGRSLLPLLRGETNCIREWLLCGYWGQRVKIVGDGQKYYRGVRDPGSLCIHSNRWSTMHPLSLPDPDARATLGPYMPGSDIPVIRQPLDAGQRSRTLWSWGDHASDLLFDLDDPREEHSRHDDTARTRRATEQLRAALEEIEAPEDLLIRLGFG